MSPYRPLDNIIRYITNVHCTHMSIWGCLAGITACVDFSAAKVIKKTLLLCDAFILADKILLLYQGEGNIYIVVFVSMVCASDSLASVLNNSSI